MKRKLTLLIFFIILGGYYSRDISANVEGQTTPIFFECVGISCPATTTFTALLSDPDNFQAWQARIYASVQGYEVGAKYGVDMCLSSNGAMYNGGEPCWTVVDADVEGVIDDQHIDLFDVRDIGNDALADLSYAVVSLTAKDVTFEYPGANTSSHLIVKGRSVSMIGPTSSKTIAVVGDTFNVSWSTSETTDGPGDVVFSYAGPVSCDQVSPTSQSGNTSSIATCTASAAGTATFTVSATGYNGKVGPRPKTISNSTNVTIKNSSTLTLQGVFIDPLFVIPNSSNTYDILVQGSDDIDGESIEKQYALINYQGLDAGSYRGYLSWGKSDYWPDDKDHVACDGGGWAVIRSVTSPGYGDEYLNLLSCSTSLRSPDIRKTTFRVSFNPVFGSNGPFTQNDISGNMMDSGGETTGWTNFPNMFDVLSSGTMIASFWSNVNAGPDVTDTTVNSGDTVEYKWTSYNATGGSADLQIYDINTGSPLASDGCSPSNNSGVYGGISGTSGYMSNLILDCQRGYKYEYTYKPTNGTDTEKLVLNISVAYPGSLPTLDSPTDTNVTSSGATLGATLVSLGVPASITDRGVCWGTSPNPTINCLAEGGVSIGAFSQLISGLNSDTIYFYKGYATNSFGTGYSADGTFTTSSMPINGVCGSKAGGGPPLFVDTRTYPSASVDWDFGDTYCSVGSPDSGPGYDGVPDSGPAFPAPDSSVTWQCLGTNGGSSPICTAKHDDPFSVTVTINTTIGGTVISVPNGISCGGTCYRSFPQNSSVSLIAVPNSSYWKFAGWNGDCSGKSSCNFVVDGTKNVTATFAPRLLKYGEF